MTCGACFASCRSRWLSTSGTACAAEFVGHPLVDELAPVMREAPPRAPNALALLPGSRWHEVESLLPAMLGGGRQPRRDDART